MRAKDIEITMRIPIKFNEPDRNGNIYTKECWEKAVKNATPIPIDVFSNGTWTNIGIAQDIQLVKKGSKTEIIATGVVDYGGTCEDVQGEHGIITSATLKSIGFAE